MRTLALAGLTGTIALTIGCAPSDQAFKHESTLMDDARGVVVTDDGTAEAGMGGATCQVETDSGNIDEDVDVAESDDEVEDGLDGVVLVRGSDGLHLYDPDAGWNGEDWNDEFDWGEPEYTPDVPGNDFTDGALFDGGILGVRGDRGLQWTGDLIGALNVPGGIDSLDVDDDSGSAFITSNGAVSVATPEGITELADGDRVAWDGAGQVLYVATAGDSVLRGLEIDGALRFSTDLLLPITAVTGAAGEAILTIGDVEHGQLVRVDGYSGELLSTQPIPAAARHIDSDDSGSTVAVTGMGETHFFQRR